MITEDDELYSSESSTEDYPTSNSSDEPTTSRPLWQLVYFLLLWQSLFRISNAALSVILKFLAAFFRSLGGAYAGFGISQICENMPVNVEAVQKYLSLQEKHDFITYVVCSTCSSIYDFDDCVVIRNSIKESKRCRHVSYPNHPQPSRRKECGTLLLKKVKSGKLVPIKVYPYQPLCVSLGRLVQREGFVEASEHWRKREYSISSEYYGDVYDGQVWKEYKENHLKNFLTYPFCYMVTLNVDWFQPFTHTDYSLGAIYLTIQNLPREIRYKEENIILVQLLPGPSEPKRSINSYMAPLVDELKQAWLKGIDLKIYNGTCATFRIALACVSCDLPASKKVCGFLSHNAKYGCHKCMKAFGTPTFGQTDYSGYDRENWPARTNTQHRLDCNENFKQNTRTGICESEVGSRYSILLNLPYFDPVRNTVIDLMHNLYLGTGKYVFKLWVDLGYLGKNELSLIEERCSQYAKFCWKTPYQYIFQLWRF